MIDPAWCVCPQDNSALQTLDLDDNQIGVDGAKALAEALKVCLQSEP